MYRALCGSLCGAMCTKVWWAVGNIFLALYGYLIGTVCSAVCNPFFDVVYKVLFSSVDGGMYNSVCGVVCRPLYNTVCSCVYNTICSTLCGNPCSAMYSEVCIVVCGGWVIFCLLPGWSMGPDFNGKQKTTTKSFPLRWQKRTKKIQTFFRHKKNKKRVLKCSVTKKVYN